MIISNVTGNFFLKQNDTATEIHLAISEVDGTPIPLDTATRVEVIIGTLEGRMLVKTPTLLPKAGELTFGLDEGDRLPVGDNLLEVHIHTASGEKRVAPSKGHYKLKVQQAIDDLNVVVTTYTLDYFLSEVNRITYGLPEIVERATLLADEMDALIADSSTLVDQSTTALAQSQAAKTAAESALATSTDLVNSAGTNAARAEAAAIAAENATSASIPATQQANAARDAANTATQQANAARDSANVAASLADGIANNLLGLDIPIIEFSLATRFLKHQPARFNGSTYRAKVETQGNPLPVAPAVENTWWALVAQRGTDGQGAVASVNGIMPGLDGDVQLPIPSSSWNDLTDKPTQFTPSAHTHTIPEITNLQATINQINDAIASIGQTGIPKLVSYSYVVPATSDGQTDILIPLDTFDKTTDTLVLFRNTTAQSTDMYSVVGRTITLTTPVATAANTSFYMVILKNVPIGPNGSINASVLLDGSLDISKLTQTLKDTITGTQTKIDTHVTEHEAWLVNEYQPFKTNANTHVAEIASTDKLGHIKPDGTTIKVDPVTGVASAQGGGGTPYVHASSTDGGTYNITLDGVSDYVEGMSFSFKADVTSTDLVRLNVNNLGSKVAANQNGSQFVSGMIIGNLIYTFRYNGSIFVAQGSGARLNDTLTSTSTIEAATANAVKQVNDKLIPSWVNITDVVAPFQSLNSTNIRIRKTAGIASLTFQLTLSASTVANTQYTLFNLPQGYAPDDIAIFQITDGATTPAYVTARVLPLGAVVIKHNAVLASGTSIRGSVTYVVQGALT